MFRKFFQAVLVCIMVSSCTHSFKFTPDTVISVENVEQAAVAEWFAWLFAAPGGFVPHIEENADNADVILMENPSLDDTSYRVRITGKKVYVEASSSLGFFYAFQFMRQLLPEEINLTDYADNIEWTIPVMAKDSAPSMCYAALVVDLDSRKMPKEDVLHLIEVMPDMGLYDCYLLHDGCYTADDLLEMHRCALEHHVEVVSEQIILLASCF